MILSQNRKVNIILYRLGNFKSCLVQRDVIVVNWSR